MPLEFIVEWTLWGGGGCATIGKKINNYSLHEQVGKLYVIGYLL